MIQPCPACKGKKSEYINENGTALRYCEKIKCYFRCNAQDWNKLSLATRAAEARREFEIIAAKRNNTPLGRWSFKQEQQHVDLFEIMEQAEAEYKKEIEHG